MALPQQQQQGDEWRAFLGPQPAACLLRPAWQRGFLKLPSSSAVLEVGRAGAAEGVVVAVAASASAAVGQALVGKRHVA